MTTDLKRRMCKLLWNRVLAAGCPIHAGPSTHLRDLLQKRDEWETRKVELTRLLNAATTADPSDDLIADALAFIGW